MRCGLVALVVCGSGIGIGCDGGSQTPLMPAHSSSFFPVRGLAGDGGPAGDLRWDYRVNGGAATPLPSTPALTVRYDSDLVRISGTTMETSLKGPIGTADSSASVAGTTSVVSIDHLSSNSPATILERDVNSISTLGVSGMFTTTRTMYMYVFDATPEPTFFDRTDLDTLSPGFTESGTVQPTVNVTATVTDSAGTRSESQTQTLLLMLSWTLDDVLATFQVLGNDYANVVQVHQVNTSQDLASGTSATAMTTGWLAKGIGLIRSETTLDGPLGLQTDVLELVNTNLIGP